MLLNKYFTLCVGFVNVSLQFFFRRVLHNKASLKQIFEIIHFIANTSRSATTALL